MSKVLSGKTIILTGTKTSKDIINKITQNGGKAIHLPLIKTKEIINEHDKEWLEKAREMDWLIFTSQNAVQFFINKLERFQLTPQDFKGNIATVGKKTKRLLENHHFSVDFLPSIFSADVFVKEFPTLSKGKQCLFLRGDLAKDTLEKGIPNLKTWTIYKTVENGSGIEALTPLIQNNDDTIIIFASPSAVKAYALHIVPIVGWNQVKIASIGHVTTNAIKTYGANVTYQPKIYTMEAVINEIIRSECSK